MNQQELTEYNLGKTIDNIVNIDPRGYGVCSILYDAAQKKAGGPVSFKAAHHILDTVKEGDGIFIFTGFVLKDFAMAETDGPPGAAALARALIVACGAKPVFVIPEEAAPALKKLSAIMGYHLVERKDEQSLSEYFSQVKKTPLSAGYVEFAKEKEIAKLQIGNIRDALKQSRLAPKYGIACECSGANKKGVYHNSLGQDISALQAKSDLLFAALQHDGMATLAIGDLGNECGMGALSTHIKKYIPRADKCECACKSGIAAATSADFVLTATVSNWGAYGLISALAFLAGTPEALHSAEIEKRALVAAGEAGLIDMYGWQVPAVDGTNIALNAALAATLEETVLSAFELREKCKPWFDKVLEADYFGKRRYN